MLQAIRTKAGGIVVKGLFALLILSFGFWGIYTRSPYFQEKSPETEIASVGGQTIQAGQLQQALEPALQRLRQQLGAAIDRDQVKQLGILDSLLNGLIDRALLDQEARRLKLDVSDDVIRAEIARNPAFRGPDGRFDRGLFAQILSLNHLTEEQFVARMTAEVPRTDILHAVTAGAAPARSEVDALFRHRGETRIADIVSLPLSGAAAPPAPSDADLQKYYDAHQDNFRAPEFRAFTMASLDTADLAKEIQIPDDKLKAEYDQRKEDLAIPEQRQIEQILAPSEAVAKQAEDALAAGKDFKEVATTVAKQDPATIDLGLMKQSEMPKELADTAYDLQLNQASQPIKTAFGWHIIRVTKIVPPSTQSFEQAKPALAAALAKEEALDKLDKVANKADDALAGGANLGDIAGKFGLKLTKVESADVGGRDPAGKPVALPIPGGEVLKTVYATEQGDTSRVIDTQDGEIFAVHTDKIVAPRVKPLDEVKAQVLSAWQQDRKREEINKEAADLAAAVTAEKPLKAVAAEKKLTVATSPPLTRKPQGDSGAPPALVAKLFGAKQGAAVSAEDGTGAYVAQLKEIKIPDAPSDAQAAAASRQLAEGVRVDLATEFTNALKNRFPVKIDREALDKAF